MKQYDLIVGFGCSFLEGGGLNNSEFYKILNHIDYDASYEELEDFKYKNSIVAYLAKLYNCEYINFAESRCPNDLIFKNIYEYFLNKKIDKKILLVGQLSLFNRYYVYYEVIQKFVKLNSLNWKEEPFSERPEMKELYDYFERHVKYVYNEMVEYEKANRQMETIASWLKEIGVDCIWMAFDGTPDKFTESNHFIKFQKDNLGAYITKKGLRLCDIADLKTTDSHLSIDGNKHIAAKIYEKLNDK